MSEPSCSPTTYCFRYNETMSRDNLVEKTKQIIRADRLELMREHADEQATYCFFASMYEVAYHIHGDKLPPRHKQAENE